MKGGVSDAACTRRSRVQLSQALQETLHGPLPGDIPGTELLHSHGEQFPMSGHFAGDALSQARNRQLDAAECDDPLPAKKARSRRTNTHQPEAASPPRLENSSVQNEECGDAQRGKGLGYEKADETALQQPKPSFPRRSYASFLKDSVDPLHSDSHPSSLHSYVREWLQSVGSDREKHCLSESYIRHDSDDNGGGGGDDDPVPRNLTRSAPHLSYTWDTDWFAMPPKSTSTRRSQSHQGTGGSSLSNTSVCHPAYRQDNLALNGIQIRHDRTRLPDFVSSHVEELRAKRRDSSEPSAEQIDEYLGGLGTLAEGCTEAQVGTFLTEAVFPKTFDLTYGRWAGLGSVQSSLMSSHLVPNNLESPFRVSQPKPDLLYGYSGHPRNGAFTESQLLAQAGLHPLNARFAQATTQGLRFPFFVIEFKTAGGTRGGDMWVATNQCAGASSACLDAVDRINTLLPKHPSVRHIDNLAYSIAVDNNFAQLHVSWKEDDKHYILQRVDTFALPKPEDFKSFRRQVRNILDWGKDTRLNQIRDALDIFLEEIRKEAAENAKTRQPPSRGSATSSRKRCAFALPPRNSSGSDGTESKAVGPAK